MYLLVNPTGTVQVTDDAQVASDALVADANTQIFGFVGWEVTGDELA